jgi:hypothetical protein
MGGTMPFSEEHFDPVTLAILSQAFEAAWTEVQATNANTVGDSLAARTAMAVRIMAAAKEGVRDPDRLRRLAIQAVDGRDFG